MSITREEVEKVHQWFGVVLAIGVLVALAALIGCGKTGSGGSGGSGVQAATSDPSQQPAPPSNSPPVQPVPTPPVPPPPPPNEPVAPPVAPVDPPPTSPSSPSPSPPIVTVPTTVATAITAWGNSQTQGYGLADCIGGGGDPNECISASAWPQVMATTKGWDLDNQAVGGTTCNNLVQSGRTRSLWDEHVNAASTTSIYGHAHNEEAWLGIAGVGLARQCIEAQMAWLAIPESQKARASGEQCVRSGAWQQFANSSAMTTQQAGATITCTVSGATVYVSAARSYSAGPGDTAGVYTITVDGQPVGDQSTPTFSTGLDVNQGGGTMNSFLRIAGLANTLHAVTYTCAQPGSTWCSVFYVAGLAGQQSATVYSLSPVPNATGVTQGNFDATTYASYVAAWREMVKELQGDGLAIVPIDVNQIQVYNPDTQGLGDGIHQGIAGHQAIGEYAARLN